MAHLRIKVLDAFYQDLSFASGSTIMVALTSGHLVLTRPEGRPAIGTDMRANTAFKLARSEPFPGSMFRTTISKERQTEHLYTWRRLKTYPLVVAVTTPTDAILADWWDSAYLSTAACRC
ncbi:hypothetical protein LP420_36180 [Massilia sp. B-10]|nr:hypothetical protein LP420_36180 [Massilia sp. B-10]